jgi:hypothetical protein
MALDPRKRQKKLAKRKAQRKEKNKKLLVQQQRQMAYQSNPVAFAARYPIHQCLANATMFAGGMGTVVVSRRAPNGDIVMGTFLLDTFCLGVKSAFGRTLLPHEYDEFIADLRQNELMQAVEPSYARKVVEGALAYAATLGLKPDPDYYTTKEIFGDIDANACAEEFTFGKDGKPFYIVGPLDSPLKQRQIMATLEKKVGVGNFHFLMPIGGPVLNYDDYDDDDYDDEANEWEFEDEEDGAANEPQRLVGGRE